MYSWSTGAEISCADFTNKFKWNSISPLKLQLRYFEHNYRYLLANDKANSSGWANTTAVVHLKLKHDREHNTVL